MTSREIMKAIVKDKVCPERMGIYEHFWPETKSDWVQQGLPEGVLLEDHFKYDLREVMGWFNTEGMYQKNSVVVEETDTTTVQINGWGAKVRLWKDRAGTPEHLAFDLTSEEIWKKKYREPLLCLDTRRFNATLDELRAQYKQHMANDYFCCYNNVTVFEIMRASMGDVIMLENMYMNPDWITDFCTVITNLLITHFEYMYREVGVPDGMFIYEDMGYTNAPFISPELQRELIMPHHKKFIDFIHSYNIPIIMHSCGRIKSFLPAMFEAGVDCLQVLEAKADQHVVDFAAAVNNKMSFMGNLNIVAFETNDLKVLDNEIVPKMQAIKKNRIPFVFHTDHSVPRTVKLSTYQHAIDLYNKYKAY